MKSSTCNCNCKSSSSAALLERPRFYPRQLVTSDVLTLGQDYVRNKQRLHNRMLHGWGVVCGLMVCPVPATGGDNQPWKIMVQPGYALAPSGEGIYVEFNQTTDLRSSPNCADPCAKPPEDPWCADVYVQRDQGIYYIAVRYTESMVRPERVQPAGCGCNDQSCENSRLRDGYEIGVLCDCPLGDEGPPPQDFLELLKCDNLGCPTCVSSPWVGLARVEVDENGSILVIDNCACRRLVASFANFWWKCDCAVITFDPAGPPIVVDRDKPTEIKIKAQGVDPNAIITVPRGVTVSKREITKDGFKLTVTVDKAAAAGPRTIVVSNPGRNSATLAGAIEVPAVHGAPPKPKRIPGAQPLP